METTVEKNTFLIHDLFVILDHFFLKVRNNDAA